MQRIKVILLPALLIGLLLLGAGPVQAHASIPVGDYTLEYGWTNEPPISGQPNSLVINILDKSGQPAGNADPSGLRLEMVYGGQTKTLTLQPLGEDTPGQFLAPLTPTRPGQYTLRISGQLGGASLNNEVQPEEVQPPDQVEFPSVTADAPSTSGSPGWLPWLGVALGAVGTLLGGAAILRRR